MNGSHIHLGVTDLSDALDWLERVWQVRPTFRVPTMACVPFGNVNLMLDASQENSRATIAFASTSCDEDFARVRERGAVTVKDPQDYPWGVRAAYVQGPGSLVFEIEQPLPTT